MPQPVGFFTDTTVCIGCKACEVACKEWNAIPEDGLTLTGMSYDNTGGLSADTWRHVAFIEQPKQLGHQEAGVQRARDQVSVDLGMPGTGPPALPSLPATEDAHGDGDGGRNFRWLMSSDVCKHCTHAACLDVCPTGSLFRTEFGTVVVQDDVCNGCGYCVAACPFGVIERRRGDEGHEKGGESHGISIKGGASSSGHANPQSHAASNGEVKNVGIAQKCTLCYDRLGAGQTPACAQACPTTSIKFGDLAEMRSTARARVAELHELGFTEARLYGSDENDGVGGTGSVFLLLDEPEVYGLPPDPRVTTADLPDMFRKAGIAGLAMLGMAAAAFVGRRR